MVVRGLVRRVVRGVVRRVVRGLGSVGSPRSGGQFFQLSQHWQSNCQDIQWGSSFPKCAISISNFRCLKLIT